MTGRGLLRWFLSAKTTVILLCGVSLLLLLNVALPQESVLGAERFAEVVNRGGLLTRIVLVDLGMGRMATSPIFLLVLGLFMLNLAAVLLARVRPTWHRVALRKRSERGLRAWARLEEALRAPLPEEWSAGNVARTLRGFGYQVRRSGDRTFWGVRHRTAPLGFLLFHISFFLLSAGGVAIYYTRFVGSAILSEGQTFDGNWSEVERQAPLTSPPALLFSVEEVEPRFEAGEPVHLGATFRFQHPGGSFERRSRVNHPARWGSSKLLVNRAGLAPVLWLQDPDGFTVDRVAVPVQAASRLPTELPLGEDALLALVHPLDPTTAFPQRDQLATTDIRIQLVRESVVVFDGTLRVGQAADLDLGRLVLEDVRYWVGVRVVSERGGGLLIAGFVAGILGLVWRLLWYRREVALTWDDECFHLVGRSEFFSQRFRSELHSICSTLAAGAGGGDRG